MPYDTIEPDAAKARLESPDGWRYLDVRTVEEFEAGHVPGAFNIPYAHRGPMGMEPNPDFVGDVQKNFPKDAKLVLSCAAGIRSMHACNLLEPAGFTAITNMDGGFSGRGDPTGRVLVEGWVTRGYPVATTPEAGRTYAELRASE